MSKRTRLCDRCNQSFGPTTYGPHRRWCKSKPSVVAAAKSKSPADTTSSTAQRLESIEKEFRDRSTDLVVIANDLIEKANRIQVVREAISRS